MTTDWRWIGGQGRGAPSWKRLIAMETIELADE